MIPQTETDRPTTDLPGTITDWAEHDRFLRRLIMSMVKNADLAEELSQETIRVALEKPPAYGGVNRGWLAGVARNLVRRHWHRRLRDGTSPAPEVEPVDDRTPDSSYLKRTALDGVAEAVDSLPEGHRETLLLSYYEECTNSELARRLRVSAKTASKRKARAKEELRRLLDARFGGAGASWEAVLAAVLLPARTTVPAPSKLKRQHAPHHSILRSPWFIAAAVPLVVAVGVVAFLFPIPDHGMTTGPEREAVAAATAPDPIAERVQALPTPGDATPSAARREIGGRGRPTSTAGSTAVEAAPVTLCTIHVLDDRDLPIQGAIIGQSDADAGGPGFETVLARTDERGRAQFSLPVAEHDRELAAAWTRLLAEHGEEAALEQLERSTRLNLRIRHPEHETRYLRPRVAPGGTFDLGSYELADGVQVRGRILESTGAPVADAFVIAGGSEGNVATLIATIRNRCVLSGVALSSPSDVARNIWGNELLLGRTDSRGEYSVPGLPHGPVSVLAVTDGGLRTAFRESVDPQASQQVIRVDLAFEPLSQEEHIVGRVVDPNGNPLPGMFVEAQSKGCWSRLKTGLDGSLRVRTSEGLRCDHAETWKVGVRDPAGRFREVAIENVLPGTRDLAVRLDAPQFLATVVRDASDRSPIREWSAIVLKPGQTPAFGQLRNPDVTAALSSEENGASDAGEMEPEAAFLLQKPGGDFSLHVWAPGYLLESIETIRGSAEQLEIQVSRSPGIRGAVLADGEPLAGATVRLHRSSWPRASTRNDTPTYLYKDRTVPTAVTEADGSFRLDVWQPGAYVLVASAEGFADSYLDLPTVEPREGRAGQQLVLERGSTVEVRVTGLPSETDSQRVLVTLDNPHRFTLSATADAEGFARFTNVPAGEWRALARYDRRSISPGAGQDEGRAEREREPGEIEQWSSNLTAENRKSVAVEIELWSR